MAQALIELAVFSAILFYLIGVSASTYLNGAYQQNSRLQMMRTALLKSYQSSKNGFADRSSGSFLMFDDRLGVDVGKYGATDRQPIIASGSGNMSTQVMQTVAWKDVDNLPVMDLRVNGQSFVLRTAGFANYYVFIPTGTAYSTINNVPAGAGAEVHIAIADPTSDTNEKLDCGAALGLPKAHLRDESLRRLTYEASNHTDFLAKKITYADASCGSNGNRAFDYRRTGVASSVFPLHDCTTTAYWSWQFDTVATVAGKIDSGNGSFPQYDVDGDLSEETLFALEAKTCSGYTAYRAAVMASSLGDVDNTTSYLDYENQYDKPGFRTDMRIYSSLTGTSLDINDASALSTSTVTKNQNDIVERIYQLNKNMPDPQDFYTRNKAVISTMCSGASDTEQLASAGAVADCCASSTQTCFDQTNKRLYVRSQISDIRGRKWTTNTSTTWQGSL